MLAASSLLVLSLLAAGALCDDTQMNYPFRGEAMKGINSANLTLDGGWDMADGQCTGDITSSYYTRCAAPLAVRAVAYDRLAAAVRVRADLRLVTVYRARACRGRARVDVFTHCPGDAAGHAGHEPLAPAPAPAHTVRRMLL